MSKSRAKRVAEQLSWAYKDWSYEAMKQLRSEADMIGCWIDPPEGWRYGFPCKFLPKEGQTLRDFIKEKGYPMKDWDSFGHKHTRVWEANKNE